MKLDYNKAFMKMINHSLTQITMIKIHLHTSHPHKFHIRAQMNNNNSMKEKENN